MFIEEYISVKFPTFDEKHKDKNDSLERWLWFMEDSREEVAKVLV